jgi:hypothetical protein
MSDAKTSQLKPRGNGVIDPGPADNEHKIIVPKNTTAKLAEIKNEEASLAYDTDQQALVLNDGSGFSPIGGGGGSSPGGANSNIQYNSSGTFAGDNGFTYDGVGTVVLSGSGAQPLKVFSSNGTPEMFFGNSPASGRCAVLTWHDAASPNGYADLHLYGVDDLIHLQADGNVSLVPNNGNVLMGNGTTSKVGLGTTNPQRDLHLSSLEPTFMWSQTGASVDNKNWQMLASGGSWYLQTLDDAASSGTNIIQIERSGNAPTSINIRTNVRVEEGHLGSSQATPPSLAPESGAGTGATISHLVNSTDTAGQIRIQTGTGANSGAIATITFNMPYAVAPIVMLTPANTDAADPFATGGNAWFVSATSTDFTIEISGAAGSLSDTSDYDLNYQVIGLQ